MLGQSGLPNKVRKVRFVRNCAKSQWGGPKAIELLEQVVSSRLRRGSGFRNLVCIPWFSIHFPAKNS